MFCGTGSIGNAFPVNSKPPAPSCANSHANSTLVQVYATCMCLPKNKAKKHGHCQKKAEAFDNYLAKEGCLEDPFSKQILRNYQPCVSTPRTLEQHRDCVNENTLSISNLAQYFILQLMRNIPWTTMTSIELRLLLLYHSKGEMLRREQSKGHRKGTRAWQKNLQSL